MFIELSLVGCVQLSDDRNVAFQDNQSLLYMCTSIRRQVKLSRLGVVQTRFESSGTETSEAITPFPSAKSRK